VLTAERPRLFDIVVPFPLASLPVAVAPPPRPPPLPASCASSALACCRRLALRPRLRRQGALFLDLSAMCSGQRLPVSR
jgi:hypothetical protein